MSAVPAVASSRTWLLPFGATLVIPVDESAIDSAARDEVDRLVDDALAEQLVALTPRGLEMVFFTNSGAESIEAALKLARAATGRTGLLSCLGSFHGKTFGALSVTELNDVIQPLGATVIESDPDGD